MVLYVFLGLTVFVGLLIGIVILRIFTMQVTMPTKSPLAQAVFDGDAEKTKSLLSAGANANSDVGVSYQIGVNGDIHVTISTPVFGSEPQEAGMSVLSYAAMQGNKEIVRLLLDRGADPSQKDKYGQTPLILAAWQGDVGVVKLLLDKGVDRTVKDQAGKDALKWAQEEGNTSVVDLLK